MEKSVTECEKEAVAAAAAEEGATTEKKYI